jgi:hypothetical protein
MTARRRLLAVASAAVAVAALTGCEKPLPIVTVVSGADSEWKEADVFCFEGQSLEQDECVQGVSSPTRIEVSPGQTVGIDVDREIVERGWYIQLAGPGGEGQAQQSGVQEDKHYFSFTAQQLEATGLRLTVVAVGEDGPGGAPSGEWAFDLVPR